MTRSPAVAGAEVSSYSPRRGMLAMPWVRSILPAAPKSSQSCPDAASRAKNPIDGRQKDAPTASIVLGFRRIDPQCDAAIDETFGISRVQVDLRIETPLFAAGFR